MKKGVIKLGVFLGALLLMTGCGNKIKENTVYCTAQEFGVNAEVLFRFNADYTKVESAAMQMQADFPELLTEGVDELAGFGITDLIQYMPSDQLCEAYGVPVDSCQASYKDNTLKISVELTGDDLEETLPGSTTATSKEDIIQLAEEEGFTCK